MGAQDFHLIATDVAAGQDHPFSVDRGIGNSEERHAGLFGRPAPLDPIAAPASGGDILPAILPPAGEGADMIAGELPALEASTAVEAGPVVPAVELPVLASGQRNPVPGMPGLRDHRDRRDVHYAALAALPGVTAPNPENHISQGLPHQAPAVKNDQLLPGGPGNGAGSRIEK